MIGNDDDFFKLVKRFCNNCKPYEFGKTHTVMTVKACDWILKP